MKNGFELNLTDQKLDSEESEITTKRPPLLNRVFKMVMKITALVLVIFTVLVVSLGFYYRNTPIAMQLKLSWGIWRLNYSYPYTPMKTTGGDNLLLDERVIIYQNVLASTSNVMKAAPSVITLATGNPDLTAEQREQHALSETPRITNEVFEDSKILLNNLDINKISVNEYCAISESISKASELQNLGASQDDQNVRYLVRLQTGDEFKDFIHNHILVVAPTVAICETNLLLTKHVFTLRDDQWSYHFKN